MARTQDTQTRTPTKGKTQDEQPQEPSDPPGNGGGTSTELYKYWNRRGEGFQAPIFAQHPLMGGFPSGPPRPANAETLAIAQALQAGKKPF